MMGWTLTVRFRYEFGSPASPELTTDSKHAAATPNLKIIVPTFVCPPVRQRQRDLKRRKTQRCRRVQRSHAPWPATPFAEG
jgi:hypothetical protein